MNDRERIIEILKVPIYPHELADPAEVVADYLIDNGVTVQKRGRCDMCSIGPTGTGSIGFYGVGWQIAIRKTSLTYDLVINHKGEQMWIPIDYCPNCGAKMDLEDAE